MGPEVSALDKEVGNSPELPCPVVVSSVADTWIASRFYIRCKGTLRPFDSVYTL